MELLNEAQISSYCHDQNRPEWWVTAEQRSEIEPPAYVLPMFELFRAIHFGARHGGLNVSGFRDCWVEIVENQGLRSGFGSLVRLLETNTCPSNNLPRDVWAHCALSPEDKAAARQDDDRPHVIDRISFRICCQKFSNLHFEAIGALSEATRKWSYDLPDEIPLTREPPPLISGAAESFTGDLVLDTNIFVELLNDLPESGILETTPCKQAHVAQALERILGRFLAPLRKPELPPGKLIVPVSVLIETYGVVYVGDPKKYKHAQTIMDIMRREGDAWRLWAAFDFEDWSLDVLGGYLTLHEALIEREPDRKRWPSFTDALVLAHGMRNRCPVASAEWIDKDDWEPVRGLFPWLRGW